MTIDNGLNGLGFNPVLFGYRSGSKSKHASFVIRSYLNHLSLIQFPSWGIITSRLNRSYLSPMLRASGLSALGNLIGHVIRVCSKEQVVVIAALSVIAFVKNLKPFWNWATHKLPNQAMRVVCFTAGAKASIATSDQVILPFVAPLRGWADTYFVPEKSNLMVGNHPGMVSNLHVQVNPQSEAALTAQASEY